MTDQDKLRIYGDFKAGASYAELRKKYAIGDPDIARCIKHARELVEAPSAAPESPAPTPTEEPMPKKRYCSTCKTQPLGANNKSGVCTPCQQGKPRPTKKAKPKQARKATKKAPSQQEEFPDVSALPSPFLAQCVAEARRRVADAELLEEALEA